jgi:hypothetical protein
MRHSFLGKRKNFTTDLDDNTQTSNRETKRFLSEKMAQELNSLRISSVQWNKDLPFVNRYSPIHEAH